MDISYDYYRVFYYVARYGSFIRAANVLVRSQPNLTKAIKNLEAQLRCTLFVRTNKGVMLTNEGEKLYDHLTIAFEHIAAAEAEIYTALNSDSGTVAVIATEVALYTSIFPAMAAFSADYPKASVKVTNASNDNAFRMLEDGLADIALLSMYKKSDNSVKAKKIREFRELLCVKAGYLSPADKNLDAIRHYPYIGTNSTTYAYDFCKTYLLSQGILKEPDITVSTTNQVAQLVKSGAGIGFISEPIASEYIASNIMEVIPLDAPPPVREIWLVSDQHREHSAIARRFCEYLH